MKPLRDRPWVIGALVASSFVALVCGRELYVSRSELLAANAHRDSGAAVTAIEHYRRSIRGSFPLNPYPARAASALRSIAAELEARGEIGHALLAWRAISGSSAATRFLYRSASPAQEQANDEIARLLAAHQRASIDVGLTANELAADHRALLQEDRSPDPFWAALLLVGFAVWIGGLCVTASRGFDRSGRPEWASARGPLLGALGGFVAFVLGMLFA